MNPIEDINGFHSATRTAAKVTADKKEAEAAYAREMAEAKSRHEPKIKKLEGRLGEIEEACGTFADRNWEELGLSDKVKSADNKTGTCTFGYKMNPPKLVVKDEHDGEDWDAKLAAAKLAEIIEDIEDTDPVKAETLRAALKPYVPTLEKKAAQKLDDDILTKIGCDVVQEEKFFLKPIAA